LKTTISTLRHAKTSYNSDRRYAGSIDVDISEEGVLEAQAAAMKMRALPYDVVVTSTLRRAYQTAEIIAAHLSPVPPIVRSRLCNERNFGIMEGLTWEDVQHLDPPVLMVSVGNDLHTVNPRGGEPFEKVWSRAESFRRFLFKRFAGREILVVSHGVFLQMFHGLLRGWNCIESLAAYPANLELTRFEFTGDRRTLERTVTLSDAQDIPW
jgi:broad specificity phosphatase PhoE